MIVVTIVLAWLVTLVTGFAFGFHAGWQDHTEARLFERRKESDAK